MLDSDTKRRIDHARSILVGRVPDPKSQAEQITIALIYKFIGDMDFAADPSEERCNLDDARLSWAEVIRHLSEDDIFEFYDKGISNLSKHLSIPSHVRDILKNAKVPYRDPKTLRRFLTVIDGFQYEHSECLGDIFEHLLWVLGTQGDGGQFRTPSHIIEFIVAVLDPQQGETILDPTCGTAGFLISAHNHMLRTCDSAKCKTRVKGQPTACICANLTGYDISPEMVRLSLVNLFLHGFRNPQIHEYDPLNSEERWNERADVIFANPPFMSSRGGIEARGTFAIQAKRSELLFVQYVVEHLTEDGRAAIIVPESLIFQTRGGAYREVRKMLVECALVAVVSLPPGTFNPYSELRTSILFLDKSLAKRSETIVLFKAENDGFGLGRKRPKIDQNDLPRIKAEMGRYLAALRWGRPVHNRRLRHGSIIAKRAIAAEGQYSLSYPRYRRAIRGECAYPQVELGRVIEFLDYRRRPIAKVNRRPGPFPYYGAAGIVDYIDKYLFDEEVIVVGEDGARWGPGEHTAFAVSGKIWVNNHAHIVRPNRELILDRYLEEILNATDLTPYVVGLTVLKLTQETLKRLTVPLPPLYVQRRIINQIDAHRSRIQDARESIAELEKRIESVLAALYTNERTATLTSG